MKKVDTIIKTKYILCMDPASTVVEDGALVVLGSEILAIDKAAAIEDLYAANEVLELGNSIVMPGMINTHTHAAMTYFRGLADDLALDTWLQKHIWPAEGELVYEGFVWKASELAALEMIGAGVTMFSDMYFFANTTAEIAQRAGIRSVLGEAIVDFPSPSTGSADDAFELIEEQVKSFQNKTMVDMAICPHSVYTCSEDTLRRAGHLARAHDLPLHIHLSETEKENHDLKIKNGLSPVKYLDRLGILNSKTVLAHSIWLSKDDIVILKMRDCKISHNPISNMKLGSGVMPLNKMDDLVIGLATDGAASNNTLDLFSEMGQAALLHKSVSNDPGFLSAEQILRMATIDAARVLGKEKVLGSLEVGKQADLISIDLNKAHLTPMYNPYSHIVYCANASDVETTMVAGKLLMKDKKFLTLDKDRVLQEAREYSEKIKKYAV